MTQESIQHKDPYQISTYENDGQTIIDTRLATLTIEDEHLIVLRFKYPEYMVESEDMDAFRNAVDKLTFGKEPYFTMLTISGIKGGISKEARDKEMFNPTDPRIKAVAMVVETFRQRIIGNLFFKLKKKKPHCVHQVFNTVKDARAWLKKQ